MLSRIIAKLEGATASLPQWMAGFAGVLFVRFFLENFSSPTPSFPAAPDWLTLTHYTLFFIGIFFTLTLVVGVLTRDVLKATKVLYFGLPIIFVAPIFDFIASHGAGYRMAYIFIDRAQDVFLRLLHPFGASGIFGSLTPGLSFEIAAIIIGATAYIFFKTRKFLPTVAGLVSLYLTFFAWGIFPSIPKILHDAFSVASPLGAAQFLASVFSGSHAAANILRPTVGVAYAYGFETIFNLSVAHLLYIIDSMLIVGWFFAWNVSAGRAFLKNIRLERILHFFLLIIAGAIVAKSLGATFLLSGWPDVVGFGVLMLAYFFACLFAIGINDLSDVDIDAISNKERPLIAQSLSRKEMSGATVFFFLWFVIGGYLAGYWSLFLVSAFTALYYIYSAPPLRLKQVPLLAGFIISLASLSAAMAGFYFVNDSKLLSAFPMNFLLLIVICFTLGVNIKDIKDIMGDRADGIKTIPVLFGEQKGKMIVGALLAVGFLAAPIILASRLLFVPSLIAAVLGYWFVVSEPYRERKIFALYFIYAIVVGLILWFAQ